MNNPLTEVKPFVYTNPQGLQLEVLFVLDPEKKGYINATAIAKQFDKEPIHWLRNQHTQAYIQELLNDMNQSHLANLPNVTNSASCNNSLIPFQTANSQFGTNSASYDNSLIPFMSDNYRTSTKSISYDDLVITIHGGNPSKAGTWLHPKLAVIFARWVSPDFAVWCDEHIDALLHKNFTPQQQVPELSIIFEKLEQQQRITDQRFQVLEQRFEESINTIAQIFNNLHAKSTQDNKHSLGQIFNSINQLNKTLSQQQQADLLKPPVEVGIKQTLLDYQHSLEQMLQQMLHGQQDELIQNYLLAIKENLERIVQHVVTEPVPAITQPVTPTAITAANLVTEITALKAEGWSWQRIAQELNARGTATVSGTGKWHGSSVKRYVESR